VSQAAYIGARQAGTLDVIVIGAGHSGLAVSYLLAGRGLQHLVLERGQVANAWRERRWDSLRLLTTNRQTRLPGHSYAGDDPDGFMRIPELVRFLEDYAERSQAPVLTNTTVTSVRRHCGGYRVVSTRGEWDARAVVIATGACAQAAVPAIARDVPAQVTQLTPLDYRSPAQIEDGGVLVVGASATGLQFADELVRAGHEVTIAVGEHVRMPRRYRGRDITEWMTLAGIFDQRYDEIDDIVRGRGLPSPQLVGDRERPILDLNSLTARGVRLAGRLMGIRDGKAQFSGSLKNVCALADLKMRRLLQAIDETVGDDPAAPRSETFADTRVDAAPCNTLSLDGDRVRTIVWATGFRPDFSWLDLPVFDRKGRLQHEGGIVDEAGLYVMGLPLMRRRKSSYIFGVEDDARDITNHLANYLARNNKGKSNGIHSRDIAERRYRRSA
jgi:putative flavoprotein involved in K+ transport